MKSNKGHSLYRTSDTDAPSQIRDRNGEVVLAMCRVCRKVESELCEDVGACPGAPLDPSLEGWLFEFLCRKYTQRSDARQKEMGLQYMTAETHDLAKELALSLKGRTVEPEIKQQNVSDENLTLGVARLKRLCSLRLPPYELPADSFLFDAVKDIWKMATQGQSEPVTKRQASEIACQEAIHRALDEIGVRSERRIEILAAYTRHLVALRRSHTNQQEIQRRVVCAANLDRGNKEIAIGLRHWDDLMRVQVEHLFINSRGSSVEAIDQGFVDQYGVFMTRTEAWKVAVAANQIVRRVGGDTANGGTLYSENLY